MKTTKQIKLYMGGTYTKFLTNMYLGDPVPPRQPASTEDAFAVKK